MDPITMMVASVGMQFFSNYKNNEKSRELQQRQLDFQKAALDHDFERARILQTESAKLALELEKEVHQQRLEDIQHNYDDVLHNFATGFTIKNWPINVLPFVMKGESFGSLFAGISKSISVHCILTPSNCAWFNTLFYDDIDLQLESEMNNNWNAQSTHPVVYYGGGWNRRERVMVGNRPKIVPSIIDLDDIDLIYTKLKSVPTIIVTPYFDSKLYFRVRIWGMGEDKEAFRIEVSSNSSDNGQFCFTYSYDKDIDPEQSEDYLNTSVSEFVQYLECLIGFLADKYFWNFYKVLPQLPKFVEDKTKKIDYKLLASFYNGYNSEIEQSLALLKNASISYSEFDSFLSSTFPIISDNQINKYKSSVLEYRDISSHQNAESETKESKTIFVDSCDILEIIEQYESFINNSPCSMSNNPTLVIDNNEFRTLSVYIVDGSTNRTIDALQSFDHVIRFQKMARDKNARLLFKSMANNHILKINAQNIKQVKELLIRLVY